MYISLFVFTLYIYISLKGWVFQLRRFMIPRDQLHDQKSSCDFSLEANSSALKIDGWKMSFLSFLGFFTAYFQERNGGVSFREGNNSSSRVDSCRADTAYLGGTENGTSMCDAWYFMGYKSWRHFQ